MTPFVNVLWPTDTGVWRSSYAGGSEGSRSSTLVIPYGDYAAGSLVVISLRIEASVTVTDPSGWSSLASRNQNGSSRVYAREMDGGEGASLSITISSNRWAAWSVYVTDQAATGEAAYVEANITGGLNPDSLTPSWGANENAWITYASLHKNDDALTMPANYEDQLDGATPDDEANSCRVASAHRVLNATSENPATWTQVGSASADPHSGVIAVRLA